MKDLIKKILRESDGLGWIDDVLSYNVLSPRTIYYFQPNIEPHELERFVDTLLPTEEYEDIKSFLMDRVHGGRGMTYFVTNGAIRYSGWCDETTPEEAKEIYTNHDFVNVREEFIY